MAVGGVGKGADLGARVDLYNGGVTVYVLVTVLVAACGGLLFGCGSCSPEK